MSVNDGTRLLVFGLGFADQDNRKMQQVLCHFDRLPSNPGSRAALFVELNNLAKELMADEAAQDQIQQLTDWMKSGGDFPLHAARRSSSSELGETSRELQNYFPDRTTHPRLNAGYIYYGPGHTINDTLESSNREVASPEPVTDDANDMHAAGQSSWEGIKRYGPGRTIDDPSEAMGPSVDDEDMGDPADEPANVITEGGDDNTRGNIMAQVYGRGRALDGSVHEAIESNAIPDGDSEDEDSSHEGDPEDEDSHMQAASEESTSAVDAFSSDTVVQTDEPHGAEEIQCPICLEDYPPSNFPRSSTITELCDHPDKACLQCLDSSITAMIERGALHLLACPICPQKLSHKNIEEYSNKEVFKRYMYLKKQSEIPGHWISCTNPKCGGSQAHESDDPKMICNHCDFATCAKHRRPWHEGQTCGEFDQDDAQIERLEDDEATAKLLAKEATSICPQCGQGVTKSEGCDHMRCQCGQEWCYVCSCSWENILRIGETAHATFCIYHPNKVNLTKAQQVAARARIMGLVHGGEVSAELAKARDELRQRRRVEIRAKAAEAAETRLKEAMEQKRSAISSPERGKKDNKSKKRKVKLVAPWEEGGWTKKAL